MALEDAMLEIAEDMEKEGNDQFLKDTIGGQILRSFSKQIKRALKAAENTAPVESLYKKPDWEREAQEEFRKKNKLRMKMVGVEEDFLGQQVEIADGPLGCMDGIPNYWSVPSGGKHGQKAILDNQFVYRLGEDNKLHFVEEETKQLVQAIKSANETGVIES